VKKITIVILILVSILIFTGCEKETIDQPSIQTQDTSRTEADTIDSRSENTEKNSSDSTEKSITEKSNESRENIFETEEGTMDMVSTEPHEIYFDSGVLFKDWENAQFPVEVDAIPDKDTAVDVANAIFKSMQKNGKFPGYIAQSVYYNEKYEVWIVTFSKDFYTPGGCCSIALQKSDAKVLCIFTGE